ncbi:MAG: VWA domain-containing protein, partial [Edaphobacter sp.]
VYPVDARGLMTAPMFDASNSGSKYKDPRAFAKDQAKFLQRTAEEHGTMQQMAQETGGHAFYNNNGLSQAVTRAVAEGSNYYTIAYAPANTRWNGAYRRIRIKLEQPNLTLTYRHGYYADNPEDHVKRSTPAAATTLGPAIRSAMMRGAPDPTQILFKVSVAPLGTAVEDKLAPGNSAVPKFKGPYLRYNVSYAANPRDVTFNLQPDGAYQGDMHFLIFVYDQDGELLSNVVNIVKANVSPASYAAALRTGLHFQQQVSVPVKGRYFLRIGIHDIPADRVGALEVPIAAVKSLAPAAVPASTSNAPPVTPKQR